MSVMVLWSDVHLILSIPSLFYLHFLVRKISILLFEYGLGYESDVFYLGIKCRWDIIAEKLGFMLVFGDLVWIPFTFSIQVRPYYLDQLFSFSCNIRKIRQTTKKFRSCTGSLHLSPCL